MRKATILSLILFSSISSGAHAEYFDNIDSWKNVVSNYSQQTTFGKHLQLQKKEFNVGDVKFSSKNDVKSSSNNNVVPIDTSGVYEFFLGYRNNWVGDYKGQVLYMDSNKSSTSKPYLDTVVEFALSKPITAFSAFFSPNRPGIAGMSIEIGNNGIFEFDISRDNTGGDVSGAYVGWAGEPATFLKINVGNSALGVLMGDVKVSTDIQQSVVSVPGPEVGAGFASVIALVTAFATLRRFRAVPEKV